MKDVTIKKNPASLHESNNLITREEVFSGNRGTKFVYLLPHVIPRGKSSRCFDRQQTCCSFKQQPNPSHSVTTPSPDHQ